MEANYWHQKWLKQDIAFHEGEANALLVRHIDKLGLSDQNRVFLPLCGKTRDIAWLLAKGFQVVGVELSEVAVKQLFDELGVPPTLSSEGNLIRYHADGIDIFVGDVFTLCATRLGRVDAVYDRAALVALPLAMRQTYTRHITDITQLAKQLLICFEYDQATMQGPPFSISHSELTQHFSMFYDLTLLQSQAVVGGLKGVCPASEMAWILEPRNTVG